MASVNRIADAVRRELDAMVNRHMLYSEWGDRSHRDASILHAAKASTLLTSLVEQFSDRLYTCHKANDHR